MLALVVACDAPIEDQTQQTEVIKPAETVESRNLGENYLAIEDNLTIEKKYQSKNTYSIKLNWPEVEAAETYKVLKADKFIETGIESAEVIVNDIRPNESFAITIVACDFYVCSEKPYTKTIQAPPAPVTETPQLLEIDSYSMEVSWAAQEGATKYLVYLDEKFHAEVTEIQAKLEGLPANSDVALQLASCKDNDCSPLSESFSYRTAIMPLNFVQLLRSSYKDSTAESRSIDFVWQARSPLVNLYKVYLNDELVAETTNTNISLDNFAAETDYTMTVRQCVSSLCASPSNPVEFFSYLLPPASLQLVKAYSNAIHLSWSDKPKAAFYQVYRDDNLIATEATTELIDTGVQFGQVETYSYQVKACIDAENCSSKSQAGEFTTDLSEAIGVDAPDPPINFQVSPSSKRIRLNWGASSDAEFYRITRNDQLLVSKTTQNEYLDWNFPANEYLTYAVASCLDEDGVVFCFAPVKETILTSPTPPDSISWQASQEGVSVSWTAVNNAINYHLYIDGTKTHSTQDNSYLITGLDYSSQYNLQLQTCNPNGCSGLSDTKKIQTVPDRISGDFEMKITSPDKVRLVWNQYHKDGVDYSLMIDGVQHFVSLTATDITFLEKNAEHSISLAVCNAVGCGAYTQAKTFFLKAYADDLPVPPPASLASGADELATILDDGSLLVTWQAQEDAHYYELSRTDAISHFVTTTSTNSYIDNQGMRDGGVYSYSIKACLEGFDADVCSVPFVKNFYYPPGVPELRLVSLSSTDLILAWEQPGEVVDEYKLYESEVLKSTIGATTTHIIFSDKATKAYNLQACNQGSCSELSPSLEVTPLPDYPTGSPGIYDVGEDYMVFELDYLEGADYYLVDLGLDNQVRYDLSSPGEIARFAVNNLQSGTHYDISFKACNHNCTPSSPSTSIATLPTPPEIQNYSFTQDSIYVAWEESPGADEYKFFLEGQEALTAAATEATLSNLQPATYYNIEIRACNTSGCSELYTTMGATTLPQHPTKSPGIYEVGTDHITFELGSFVGSEYVLTDLGLEYEHRYDLGYTAEATRFAVTGLQPETNYDISFKNCHHSGCTPSSPATRVLTLATPPLIQNYSLTQDSIYLAWEEKTTAHEYKVFLEGQENLTTVTREATLSSLESSQFYEFEVKACNTSGCSELYTTMGATTLPQYPTKSPGIYEVGTDHITFELGSFVGSEYVLTDLGLEYEYRYDLGYTAEATRFAVTGLQPETNYDISFKNCHHSGCTPSSPATRVLTLATPPLIQNYSLTQDSIYLAWEEKTTAHEYKVFLEGQENLATVTREATLSSLESSQFYEFEVKACNSSGCSNLQATMGATTLPEAVENIRYTQGSTSIQVIFDEPPRVLYYKVYNFGNFAGTIEAKNIHNSTIHFNKVSLEIGLEACNTNGCSETTTGQAFTPLSNPVSFSVTPVTKNSALLTWDATTDADIFYQIYVNDELLQDNFKQASYQMTNLEPGETYSVNIAICRDGGCLLHEEPVVFATIPRKFDRDTILVEQAVPNQVNLILELVLGADRYKIDFSGQQAITIVATTRLSLYPSPSHLGDYELRVTACNRSGCAEASEAYQVEFAPTTSASQTWYQIIITEDKLDISWTTHSDASFYKLYLEGPNYTSEGTFNLDDYVLSKEFGEDISEFSTYLTQVLPINAATQTFVLDSSNSKISKASTYSFAVVACNASGCTSIQDSLLAFQTLPDIESLAIESTSSSDYSIFVDWSGADAVANQYIVEIEHPDLDNTITTAVDTSELEIQVPFSNARYQVSIHPCVPQGCSSHAATTFVRTLPDNHRIAAFALNEKKLEFSWLERPTEDATLIWTFQREDGHRYNQDIPEGQPDIYSFVSSLPFSADLSFEVTRQVSLRENFAYIDGDANNPIDYSPFNLQSNKKYRVSVSVCGFFNCNTEAATYLFSLPPDPTKFTDFDFRTDSTSISTSWSDPDEADTYLVYVDNDYSNPATTTSEATFTLSSLTSGTTYSFSIHSCNLEACSHGSMDFDLQVGPGPVSASGTILSSGSNWLEMNWQLGAGHSFPNDQLFGIFLNDSNQPAYLGTEPASVAAPIRIENLELGTNYSFSVAACDSLYSCGDRQHLFDYLTWPVKPELLLPVVSTNTVALSWVQPEEQGLVYGVKAGGIQFELSQPATTITGLQPGTPYSFYAANCRTYAKCTLSDEVIIYTIPEVPYPSSYLICQAWHP